MRRTVEDAAASIEPGEGLDELRIQARRARSCGLDLTYVDCHMGISVTSAYVAMCAELGVQFIYRGVDPHHVFDSLYVLSLASPTTCRLAPPTSSAGSSVSRTVSTS